MFYKARHGCKVVPVEPFAIMSGHTGSSGFSRIDTDGLLFARHGLETQTVGRTYDRAITACSDLIVVHNFTNQEINKIDPAGVRTTIPHESMYRLRHNHLFSDSGNIPDDIKLKLEHQCTIAKRSLEGCAVIIKLTNVFGANIDQLRNRVASFGFSTQVRDTILNSAPENVRVGNTFSYVYEFMLVYLIHESEFDTCHTVVEPQSQVCLTRLGFDDAYSHPLDQRAGCVDVSSLIDPMSKGQPCYVNLEIVYHNHPFEPRFTNINGKACLVPQNHDTTRDEGFHLTQFRIVKDGKSMAYSQLYLPPDKMNEDNGFYFSAELALQRRTTEQAEKANEELSKSNNILKSLKVDVIKDVSGATKVTYDKLHLLTERSLEETRSYVQKQLDKDNEALLQANKTIEKLQEELRDNKRSHEAAMQSRKELLETIRLVPPLLGVVAAVMAIRKKNQQ